MKKSYFVAAAVSGLVLAAACTSTSASEKSGDSKSAMGECHGVNGCKGQGECGGKGHGCAGKNTCKGKGWKKMSKADCEAKGGEFKAM